MLKRAWKSSQEVAAHRLSRSVYVGAAELCVRRWWSTIWRRLCLNVEILGDGAFGVSCWKPWSAAESCCRCHSWNHLDTSTSDSGVLSSWPTLDAGAKETGTVQITDCRKYEMAVIMMTWTAHDGVLKNTASSERGVAMCAVSMVFCPCSFVSALYRSGTTKPNWCNSTVAIEYRLTCAPAEKIIVCDGISAKCFPWAYSAAPLTAAVSRHFLSRQTRACTALPAYQQTLNRFHIRLWIVYEKISEHDLYMIQKQRSIFQKVGPRKQNRLVGTYIIISL